MHSSKANDTRADTYTLKNQHLFYTSACTDLVIFEIPTIQLTTQVHNQKSVLQCKRFVIKIDCFYTLTGSSFLLLNGKHRHRLSNYTYTACWLAG